ncbi:thiol reductant ABC exporter subunit CydC [Alteribacillus iranensis]|uniref:ATP-binding cassette, subfamily C, CydC n=1 Tax=Alteribacillus iranensis TaxID=930128 RepID=A0A1I2EXR9_9BACI|nr:thiol reductant ABC exporter subunit CydC [Alteribacillus iranensis]SFE97081.1 ATP-binding cassette, subfamily C, CydC [Alteribacillus iranensis]
MKNLFHTMKVMKREKKDIVISIMAGFVAGVTAVGLFGASGYLISKSALAPPLYALIVVTSLVKLLGFIRAGSRYAERYFSHRATFTVLSHLRVSFFEKLEPLAPTIFQSYKSGDLLARIVGDIESLQHYFLRVFYPPIVAMMVFLATMLFTSFYSIYVAAILVIGLFLTTCLVPAYYTIKQQKKAPEVRRKRGVLSTEVTEFLYGFRDLKIYHKLGEKETRLGVASNEYVQEQKSASLNLISGQSLHTFVSLFITWLVLSIGAYLVSTNQLDGIWLAMLVLISLTVFEEVGAMATFPMYLQESQDAAGRLSAFMKTEDREGRQKNETDSMPPLSEPLSIEMDHVTFQFPDSSRPVIQEMTLSISSGQKIAIVGPSGSGKSTLLQLILNIYDATEGEVRLNDLSVKNWKKERIWKNTKVVLQDNHFFHGTVKDNLQLAADRVRDDEMVSALEKVSLHSFSLEQPVYEKGANLSGGEKQRLAIARAMLKPGRLWLLDEPVSSVDAWTTKQVYHQLFEEASQDTLLLVSHRLAGLEMMDKIIVMDKGRIIEAGAYDELLDRKGYFYEMVQIEKNLF